MNPGHEALLKEVYERKGKKVVAQMPNPKMPPFMKGKTKPDEKAKAMQNAAKSRLAKMQQAKKGAK